MEKVRYLKYKFIYEEIERMLEDNDAYTPSATFASGDEATTARFSVYQWLARKNIKNIAIHRHGRILIFIRIPEEGTAYTITRKPKEEKEKEDIDAKVKFLFEKLRDPEFCEQAEKEFGETWRVQLQARELKINDEGQLIRAEG